MHYILLTEEIMDYKKAVLVLVALTASMFIAGPSSDCFAARWHTLGSDWELDVSPELRMAYNVMKDTGDLNSRQDDDLDYASYIYNIPIKAGYRKDATLFINIISEGPSHYAAPLESIETYVEGARVKKNGDIGSALNPGINEAWLKIRPLSMLKVQLGQAPYSVGNGYALGGQYNNYGVTVAFEQTGKAKARFRYSILDYENRLYGLRSNTINKWDLGRSDDSEASLYAADVVLNFGGHTFQPYAGLLYDHSSAGRRSSHGYYSNLSRAFTAKRDKIYTFGLSASLDFTYVTFEFEGAKNFGKTSSDTTGWDDIEHKGYLIHTAVKGHMGMFTPRAKVVVASGNKVDRGDPAGYLNGTLQRTDNNAFAVFSPLNTNLVDSFAHKATVPVVAMAGGYPMNYGIRRPGTYNDPHVWENIVAYNIGVNIAPVDKAFIMFDFWHLRAKERGIGQSTAGGSWEYLSDDLGDELDVYATYSVTKIVTVGIHGGYFWPGDYYQTKREDNLFLWNNNISQTMRTDGFVSSAYQAEVFITFKL